jgi:DnaJ-domain-containing protein 1
VATTTSNTEFQRRPEETSSAEALRHARVRQVARALASHPVLPSLSELSRDDGSLRQLLADLARGNKSPHAGIMREASEEQGVSVDEIARRAQFMLACLLLPVSGTFYEILGVAPRATAAEIREHWTAAIRRYHPDHFGGQNPWLDAQARRLIEAYETLRDPERRRQYDADLAWRHPRVHPPMVAAGSGIDGERRRYLGWWLAVLVLIALVAGVWVWTGFAPNTDPLEPVPVPPSPRLLETWRSRFLAPPPAEIAPGGTLRKEEPRETRSAPPGRALRAPAPEVEPKASRPAPEPSVGPADSDRDHRAAALREPARASSERAQSEAGPAMPAAADRPLDTVRTDR